MTGSALARVDRETGEIVLPERFDAQGYLKHLRDPATIALQQELAAAYDAACRALIGPNDVEREGGREFKKKSAWRKLQRHFGICTEVVHVDRNFDGTLFVASVTIRARAPWGQYSEAVGACGTDEETAKRKISIADAIAIAETRATNRAVSNLIAMGEVPAEDAAADRGGRGDQEVASVKQLELLNRLMKSSVIKEPERAQLADWIAKKPTKDGASRAIDYWTKEIQARKAKGGAAEEATEAGAGGVELDQDELDDDLPF